MNSTVSSVSRTSVALSTKDTDVENAPLMHANCVCKIFDNAGGKKITALDAISLKIFQGRVTGLVGADGAGKTTLIRIAAGLLVPTAGQMTLLGLDSVEHSLEIQSRVGYMPQKFGLYQDLTVIENLRLYADLQGVALKARHDRFDKLLAMTDLAPYTRRRAGALSGGMKQKLGLACALVKSPELLLLDEPTVGVDPVSRRELWKIVYELVEKERIGVLVSTAYLDEAQRCDQVKVLHQGRLLDQGSPDKFTAGMKGRVFLAAPDEQMRARQIYTRLAGQEGIADATIRSGRVRVVLDSASLPENGNTPDIGKQKIATLLKRDAGTITTATPSFEDAFMALIPRGDAQLHRPVPDQKKPWIPEPSSGDDAAVITNNLCKKFGDFTAVSNLTLDVRRGEIFGLLGPNGAGKSTTFRMLCGLLPATSGEIRVAGRNLRRSRAKARARLGYMAQQFSLYGQLSVEENFKFFGRAYGLSGSRLKERMAWAYTEFGLGVWRDKPAGTLPGGYKQRLSMATALLHEPDILFLDEPTSGVDPFARREFWLRINGFAEQGVTVIVTTHFMEEAEYCDRMVIISRGKTLAMGTPGEIRSLAGTPENPEPTMDDAFIVLSEGDRS
ncbi:ATP-binding cassette domain-containing protein [Desulfobacter postgatei]|jgi:ABC-2 type transport system ATP-binding protein|uniref:ATP-binding cassette domain-containing protein n=1 Tax=Desulfobacter postgatei TaxID=2293 RepID=UPI002A3592CC|nr:ATP-binding cassette domain-containing protein [Desulfobacter postgatei]MDX9962919.1 ATP-binding cassette domain-containing protein [Desulfobacter postgatei]